MIFCTATRCRTSLATGTCPSLRRQMRWARKDLEDMHQPPKYHPSYSVLYDIHAISRTEWAPTFTREPVGRGQGGATKEGAGSSGMRLAMTEANAAPGKNRGPFIGPLSCLRNTSPCACRPLGRMGLLQRTLK